MDSEQQKSSEKLQKILKSYQRYYNVITENVPAPFTAYGEFLSHSEQYFLVKEAKITEINSNEYVYFYTTDSITLEKIQELSQFAWNNGLEKVKPDFFHRNSDITLIIISDNIAEDVLKQCKKIKFSKSYAFSLKGWSNFRLAVYCTKTNRTSSNRLGRDLRKLFT